jgi:cytochrome c peroxidase
MSLAACQAAPDEVRWTAQQEALIRTLSPVPSPPVDPANRYAQHPKARHLGQYLFFEPRLSGNGKFSCASCHNPALGWSDGKALATGVQTGRRNSPTLWNVAHQRWLFWDGRSDSVWGQALQPLESTIEMDGDRLKVAHLIGGDPSLRSAYEHVFGRYPDLRDRQRFPASGKPLPAQPQDPSHLAWSRMNREDQHTVNRVFANVGKALDAYQRQIISRPAPFDTFAEGLRTQDKAKQAALSLEAQKGLRIFIGRGQCILCHTGPTFSDLEFHNIGLPKVGVVDMGRFDGISALRTDLFTGAGPFSDVPPEHTRNDKLLYLTQQESNRGEFKTPTLRNIAQTAPYMHDGRFASLEQVLAFYAAPANAPAVGRREDTLQDLKLSAEDMLQLKAFLEALTGPPLPAALTQQPPAPAP